MVKAQAKEVGIMFRHGHMSIFIGSVFSLVVVVTGCGSSADVAAIASSAATSITGNVTQAPVSGATVTLYSMKADGSKGSSLGSTRTDADGNYTLTSSSAPTGATIAEATGGSYVDEATGATITMTALDTLQATLPVGTKVAAVTPFTHMAAARAFSLIGTEGLSLASAIATGYLYVETQYSLTSILGTLPVSANIAPPTGATDLQKQYGVKLAAVAKQAQLMSVRAHMLASFLARDMADGLLDGKLNSLTALSIPTFGTGALASSMPTQFAASFQTAVDAFLSSTSNLSGLVAGFVFTQTATVTGVNLGSLLSTFTTSSTAGASATTTSAAVTTLEVIVNGSGSVGSSPSGIKCPGTCSFAFPSGQIVFFGAVPASGKTFTGWSGACTGTTIPCKTVMDFSKTLTATFSP